MYKLPPESVRKVIKKHEHFYFLDGFSQKKDSLRV